VEPEPYGHRPHEVNVLAELAGTGDGPTLEVGAHWDSVIDGPGADDNASGVAGVLAIARVCATGPAPGRTLRFCYFGGEEADIDLDRFTTADFIAAIGNDAAAEYLEAIWIAGHALDPPLAVLPVAVSSDHTAHGARSDHRPYWLSGRKGVMITDTAEFRNANYHRATDTLDTLDLDFAAQVTRAVAGAVRALSP